MLCDNVRGRGAFREVFVGIVFLLSFATFSNYASSGVINVTKFVDTDDGTCDADCSLREAINYSSDGDTVILPGGKYTLSLYGDRRNQLQILNSISIIGSADEPTIVQASETRGTAKSRVIEIGCCAGNEIGPYPTVNIENLTIRNGYGERVGGGIHAFGNVTIKNSTIVDNIGYWGGGIFVVGASSASNLDFTLINSTISNNSTENFSYGGAYGGGGLAFYRLDDSAGSEVYIYNSTIANNYDGTSRNVGGVWNSYRTKTYFSSTIVSGNSGNQCLGSGLNSLGYNLSSDYSCDFSVGLNDLVGVDPMLGLLKNNGGGSDTHQLLPGSPAIDRGINLLNLEFDQRGYDREFGNGIDIGAYEVVNSVPLPSSFALFATSVFLLGWSLSGRFIAKS